MFLSARSNQYNLIFPMGAGIKVELHKGKLHKESTILREAFSFKGLRLGILFILLFFEDWVAEQLLSILYHWIMEQSGTFQFCLIDLYIFF